MTEVVVWNLVTLNGFFNGAQDWQIDWHNQVWSEELEKFSISQLKEIDTLIFGRKTYQGMAAYWQSADGEGAEVVELMNNVPKIVFSRTLENVEWNNTELVKEDAVKYIQRLRKSKKDKNRKLFIFGSADLISSLHNARLIDEYRLCLCPVVLGEGMSLFKKQDFDMELNLDKTEVLKSGAIIMWLTPKVA